MFNRKQNEIDKLNARCVELAQILKEKSDGLKIQTNNNLKITKEIEKIKNENADLRSEIDEVKDSLRLINKLITSNQYDNDDAIKRKIIELSDMTGNLQITQ